MSKSHSPMLCRLALAAALTFLLPHAPFTTKAEAASDEAIKAYCLDFNWAPTNRRGRPFAKPGQWANADPAEHVAWYEKMGANVIQTFAVSTNGYAWYKDGFVPEQPGLEHDFLTEMVKLGHERGMQVFGYFCAASNPRWAELHPEQSYGNPTSYHIPYTDDYLDYLSKSIHDAVTKTGMDGFMVDWLWMPKRESTDGKWLESEKQLYKQLMGEDFPGEDKLTNEQDTAYSRKAIYRAWQAIRKAAKSADPECIIWLTVNKMHHPHITNSEMYEEVDWLMNEAGRVSDVIKARDMVGAHTQLITCLAAWNGSDPSTTVPEAIAECIGLYGFTTPHGKTGVVDLEKIFSKQVTELGGDDKNIAMLARAYHGVSEYAEWKDGKFVEAKNPPPFRLTLQRRGRGFQDTARVDAGSTFALITVKTVYDRGKGTLLKTGDTWPKDFVFQMEKAPGVAPANMKYFAVSDGETGVIIPVERLEPALLGEVDPKAKEKFSRDIQFALKDTRQQLRATKKVSDARIIIRIPDEILQKNPERLEFYWGQ